jgi:hypothetical protein
MDKGINLSIFNQSMMMTSLNQGYLKSKNHLKLECMKMKLLCGYDILVLVKHMEEENMQMLTQSWK